MACRDEAIRNVSDIFEALFESAKNINEATDDPVWEFSDRLGVRVIKSSLKALLLKFSAIVEQA
jgi:hypothetical protein